MNTDNTSLNSVDLHEHSNKENEVLTLKELDITHEVKEESVVTPEVKEESVVTHEVKEESIIGSEMKEETKVMKEESIITKVSEESVIKESVKEEKTLNDLIENFRKKRGDNQVLNWQQYIKQNSDLHFIRDPNKAVKHWIEHGLKEDRKYNINNVELKDNWTNIYKYLNKNYYKYESFAFIITTCVRRNTHLDYLKKCISSIKNVYNDVTIYVINDNSCEQYNIHLALEEFSRVEIIDSIVKGGGEINPYLFILDSRCRHDKLVYLHDSAFLKENIDRYIYTNDEILFFWKCESAIFNDTINKLENKDIYNNFYFYFSNSKISLEHYLQIVRVYKHVDVKFGSMSIFTKQFMNKVTLVTNFIEASKYFTCRINRCFFERILSIIYLFIYNEPYSFNKYICGDINNHPFPFKNDTTDLEIFVKQNKNIKKIPFGPIVKVWQGR